MNSRYAREIDTPARAAKAREGLTMRDALRRQAQTIMHVNDGRKHNDQHRVCWCSRHAVSEGGLPVFRRLDGTSARVGSVKTCGSVWACPVCAKKVAEKRRAELSHAQVAHQAAGGHSYLLTFTAPHHAGQSLADLVKPMDKARQSFQNAKGWKKVMGKDGTAGRVGSVTGQEVTIGAANGWHPHFHMIIFAKPGAFGDTVTDEAGRMTSAAIEYFKGQWVTKLEKAGLVDASNRTWALQYALDVRGGEKAAEYIAKWGHDESWGMTSELTRSHAKTGKRDVWGARDHYTPFQLLEMSAAGDGHATCAFREFVNTFDGKRMLTWSPGLKDHFGIHDLADEEAAAEEGLALNDEHPVGEIDQTQLTVLVSRGAYGRFLAFIAEHGHLKNAQGLIDEWIREVQGEDPRRRGTILVDRLVIGPHSYWHVAEEFNAEPA